MLMNRSCPKGCEARGLGRHGAWGRLTHATRTVPITRELWNDYRRLSEVLRDIDTPPRLEVHEDLGGVGGEFIGSQWLIRLDLQDVLSIARSIREQRWDESVAFTRRAVPQPWISRSDVVRATNRAVLLRMLAHELGHAAHFAGTPIPRDHDKEAGADFLAGAISAVTDLDVQFGALVFHHIGCTGPSCSHPSPRERACAYVTGFQQQLAA